MTGIRQSVLIGKPMANRLWDMQTNIVQLRQLAECTLLNEPDTGRDATLTSSSISDPIVVDGLRLLRSFRLIEERDTRQSVIQIVEKIAGQN
jgi:hypothetical protein